MRVGVGVRMRVDLGVREPTRPQGPLPGLPVRRRRRHRARPAPSRRQTLEPARSNSRWPRRRRWSARRAAARRGCMANRPARQTRRFSPPESLWLIRSARWAMPSPARAARARASASSSVQPILSGPKATSSITRRAEQLVVAVLEQKADTRPHRPEIFLLGARSPNRRTVPVVGSLQPDNGAQQRRLAGPVRPDDGEPLAGFKAHGGAAQHRAAVAARR